VRLPQRLPRHDAHVAVGAQPPLHLIQLDGLLRERAKVAVDGAYRYIAGGIIPVSDITGTSRRQVVSMMFPFILRPL